MQVCDVLVFEPQLVADSVVTLDSVRNQLR